MTVTFNLLHEHEDIVTFDDGCRFYHRCRDNKEYRRLKYTQMIRARASVILVGSVFGVLVRSVAFRDHMNDMLGDLSRGWCHRIK